MVDQLQGQYSIKSKTVRQADHQIEPQHWKTVDGYKLPVRGPFTQVTADRGTAVLYVSQPGEVPLYYSLIRGAIRWSEWSSLPNAVPVKPGTAVVWNPQGVKVLTIESLPCPPIDTSYDEASAITKYKELLLAAVQRRLPADSQAPIAVAQSGGADSTLVAWALNYLGRAIVPITASSSSKSQDVLRAGKILAELGCPAPITLTIPMHDIDHLHEAVSLYGGVGRTAKHLQQAASHLAIAQKCKELGIHTIFAGHGQDDIQGRLSEVGWDGRDRLKSSENQSIVWRDIRVEALRKQPLLYEVIHLNAGIFRPHNIEVRMPYFDFEFMSWVLSQPTNIVPVSTHKPLVLKVLRTVLPNSQSYFPPSYSSTGFTDGAGFPRFTGVRELPFYQELQGI